jgi:hypothetical protein
LGKRSAVSAADPLRVWVGGDSLVPRVGEALTNRGSRLGNLKVTTTYKISSGLCRPDYFDWPAAMKQAVANQHPEVAVVMFGGNDYQDMVVDGKRVGAFTPVWTKEYERRVREVVQILTEDGGRLYWVGVPAMRDARESQRIEQLNALYRRVVAAIPEATYIDAWSLLADADGHYTAYQADGSGMTQRIREPDGQHLTYLGGERVAAAILAEIRRHWKLEL